MRIVVVTGLGGSGKTNALRALEDAAYYAIDNLPVGLLEQLIDLFGGLASETEKLALVVDARTLAAVTDPHRGLSDAPRIIDSLRAEGHDVSVVFLDASTDTLERRYSETRRRHPLTTDGSAHSGIQRERALLEPLRQIADTTIDTSQMSVHDLRRTIQHAFVRDIEDRNRLSVTVLSFGFKHGLPTEAETVFDVRFLDNPYFVEGLRAKTGLDEEVYAFVRALPDYAELLSRTTDLLTFLLPRYLREGKAHLTIAVGCTGGKHRSVTFARDLQGFIHGQGLRCDLRHRDVGLT